MALLQIEGRITQQTVQELQSSCERSLADHHTVRLDLNGVQFADAAGIDALRTLRRRGAVLVGCSGFLTEMLGEDAEQEAAPEPRPTDERTEEMELLARLQRGEDDAFTQLVRQHSSRLLVTARRLLGNEHDAQDALQEAFLSAFRAIGQFTGAAKLSTWLHRIVVNAALMKLRSRRRKSEESLEDLLPYFDAHGEWVNGVTSWETPSDVLLQRRETRTRVRGCIDRLPETYRVVLLLRDIEELGTEAAADLLGITANAVKIRLHRARQALRTLLERELVRETTSPALR